MDIKLNLTIFNFYLHLNKLNLIKTNLKVWIKHFLKEIITIINLFLTINFDFYRKKKKDVKLFLLYHFNL